MRKLRFDIYRKIKHMADLFNKGVQVCATS
jgi:hypothetical protein